MERHPNIVHPGGEPLRQYGRLGESLPYHDGEDGWRPSATGRRAGIFVIVAAI